MQVVYNTTSLKQRKRYKNNKKYKLKKTQTMKKNTMNYSAPEVELVEVAVESGFQTSPTWGDEGEAGQDLGFNDYEEAF